MVSTGVFDPTIVYKKYICISCDKLQLSIFQSCCGYRYCFACTKQVEMCEHCNNNIVFFADNAANKEIKQIKILCEKCGWQGSIKDYIGVDLQSKISCENHYIPCENMQTNVGEETMCDKCLNMIDTKIYATHYTTCSQLTFPCKYQNAGCNKILLKEDKDAHEKDMNAHMDIILSSIGDLKKDIVSCKANAKKLYDTEIILQNYNILRRFDQTRLCRIENSLFENQNTDAGEQIWVIKGVCDLIKNKKIIMSEPFFINKFGYKYILKAYMAGDGMGANTHLSVFMALMKGPYDAILQWPYSKKISFTICGAEKKDDIVEMFQTDISSVSFKKPEKEMNPPSGIPLMCTIEKLSTYTYNDTIYIKIKVY
ncbi:putative TRAF-like protein [Namao virus]|nr:putative TRAF-like protein [Namao virus]